MIEQATEVTLEDVRAHCSGGDAVRESSRALTAIQDAAARLGEARDGVGAAGQSLSQLASSLDRVASGLSENAGHLREGVDAIRAGDPAEIMRRIEGLDAAFTAMQSVMAENMESLNEAIAQQGQRAVEAAAASERSTLAVIKGVQLKGRILTGVFAMLVLASILMMLLR